MAHGHPRGLDDAECCGCWVVTVCAPCIFGKYVKVATQRIAFKRNWTRSNNSSTDRLCWHCSGLLQTRETFDSGSTYFTSGGRSGQSRAEEWLYDPPEKLGDYSAIKRRAQDCACCDVVTRTLDLYLPHPGLQPDGSKKYWKPKIRIYPAQYGCHVSASFKTSKDEYGLSSTRTFQFRIFYGLSKGTDVINVQIPWRIRRCVALEQHTARVIGSQMNFDSAREAYQRCKRSHATCRARGYEPLLRNPQHMRLIDVKSLCLVMAPSKCDYVTLSYVWGNVNTTPLANPDSPIIDLSGYLSRFPQTIQDSVGVVRAMGLRYLWVDDICILDTAAVSKISQLGDMHKIYGNAAFTIVAGQGSNASEGLYGVRPDSRPNFEHQISSPITDQVSLVRELALPAPLDTST